MGKKFIRKKKNLVDVDREHLEDLGASYDDDIFNLMHTLKYLTRSAKRKTDYTAVTPWYSPTQKETQPKMEPLGYYRSSKKRHSHLGTFLFRKVKTSFNFSRQAIADNSI